MGAWLPLLMLENLAETNEPLSWEVIKQGLYDLSMSIILGKSLPHRIHGTGIFTCIYHKKNYCTSNCKSRYLSPHGSKIGTKIATGIHPITPCPLRCCFPKPGCKEWRLAQGIGLCVEVWGFSLWFMGVHPRKWIAGTQERHVYIIIY